jgi:hypothetical protein
MNDLTVGLTVVFAGVIAFGIQQWLRVLYEHREERRKLEIGYLIEAYRALSILMNRAYEIEDGQSYLFLDRLSHEEADAAEMAISTVGLHGSPKVVEAAVAFVEGEPDEWDMTGLMVALRQDLRERLKHEPIAEDFTPWVRIERPTVEGYSEEE